MRIRRLLAGVAAVSIVAGAGTGAAAATTVFSDGTFAPANYNTVISVVSDPAVTEVVSQCASCGNPGSALEFQFGMPDGGGVFNTPNILGVINTTFAYDPSTQGAITSLAASVDKDITVNDLEDYGNAFHVLLEQGGNFYTLSSAPSGPVLVGPGTTGFNTISGGGFTAADFVQINPTTGVFGSANPNFDGGTILFGFYQEFGASALPGTTNEAVFDNLSFTLTSVPEPATWAMLLVGFFGLGAMARTRRRVLATVEA